MEENINPAWGRIMQIIKENDVRNPHKFSKHLGLKRSENLYQIKKGNHGISKSLATTINKMFPQYSVGWLISGENYNINLGVEEVPFYEDTKSLIAQNASNKHIALSQELANEAECATIYVEEAMSPKIPTGSYVLLKKSNTTIYGKIYLVQLEDYSFFRIARKAESDEYIKLCSSRPEEFEDLLIKKDEVLAMYEVRSIITRIY